MINQEGEYSHEHAVVKLWNHTVQGGTAPTKSSDHIHAEIDKAQGDKAHPLSFHNAQAGGFYSKTKTRRITQERSYYGELHSAASTVHALTNHPSLKTAVQQKMPARVEGEARQPVSKLWASHGATQGTSRADMIIGGNAGDKHYYPISIKKGNSQLMSSQASETTATYDHATNEHMKANKGFTAEHKAGVMAGVKKVGNYMNRMKGADHDTQRGFRAKAQGIIDSIHNQHPGLIKHLTHEAATGEGKFSPHKQGTARLIATTLRNDAHVHDTATNHEPITTLRPRVALPKKNGAPGNFKLDYKTVHLNRDSLQTAAEHHMPSQLLRFIIEDAPTNSMGASSSSPGTGAIDTIDPILNTRRKVLTRFMTTWKRAKGDTTTNVHPPK